MHNAYGRSNLQKLGTAVLLVICRVIYFKVLPYSNVFRQYEEFLQVVPIYGTSARFFLVVPLYNFIIWDIPYMWYI